MSVSQTVLNNENRFELLDEPISSVIDVDGENVVVYGIAANYVSGAEVGALRIENISSDADDVRRLIARIGAEYIEPCQLRYIVEDYVEELAGV